jgi:Fur family ferric uptake transcriptional regulator
MLIHIFSLLNWYPVSLMNLEKILKSSGKKCTPERLQLGQWMKQRHLFTSNQLQESFPNIGRASIFRNVKLFAEIWYLRKINLWENFQLSYEVEHEHHHHEHMKCLHCWDVLSFESDNICKKLFVEAKKLGFKISDHSLSIMWTCKKCIS